MERSLDNMYAAIKPPPPPTRSDLTQGYNAPVASKVLGTDSDMSYSVGERVWVRDQNEPWEGGVVTEVDEDGHPRVMVDGYEEGFYWEETSKDDPTPKYTVGERVFVRDDGEAAWEAGVVVEVKDTGKPRVLADGYDTAFLWDEVSKTHPGGRLASELAGDEGDPDGGDFRVGDRIFVRDAGEGWGMGTVTEVDEDGVPRIVQDGLDEAFYWDEVSRHAPAGWRAPGSPLDGDESPDAPAETFRVGELVFVRDAGEAWAAGTVREVDEFGDPRVVRDGYEEAFYWDECTKDTPSGFVLKSSYDDSSASEDEDSGDELMRHDSSSEEEDSDGDEEEEDSDEDSEDEAGKLLV